MSRSTRVYLIIWAVMLTFLGAGSVRALYYSHRHYRELSERLIYRVQQLQAQGCK